MDNATQMQAVGAGLFILSPIMLAKASSWARIMASKQRSFLGIVHPEGFIRASYRFGSLASFLFGLVFFASVYAIAAVPYIAATIFISGFVFIVYCLCRFAFRRD
jgi:hypothetical protein